MLLASGVFTVPVLVVTAPSLSACFQIYTSIPACGLLAAIVLFCTLGAFILMNRWQRYISATEAGLVYSSEPVFASLLALFLPGLISVWAGINYHNETVSLPLLLGGGLITAANVLLQSRWLESRN
jgi:drug/metabolite transporter (DMT)-like permease